MDLIVDPHVHLRDWKESRKETVQHGLEVARDSGIAAVFDMPNTDPAILEREQVVDRLRLAEEAGVDGVFYGIYVGLNGDPEQAKRAAALTREFPQVVGIKLYAGHSTNNLGVIGVEEQRKVYAALAKEGYNGVLAVHCEKEELMHSSEWNPSKPISHCVARPAIAEIVSVTDQIENAREAGFEGKLHIVHVSVPETVEKIDAARSYVDISCGVCPHHLFYDWRQMDREDGLLWKMNPPLRDPSSPKRLIDDLKERKIDWVETDHAPHKRGQKMSYPHCSGIPSLPWWPFFVENLRNHGFSTTRLEEVTSKNVIERFEIDVPSTAGRYIDHRKDYEFSPWKIFD